MFDFQYRDRELWSYCQSEYKTDAQFAYDQYFEERRRERVEGRKKALQGLLKRLAGWMGLATSTIAINQAGSSSNSSLV